ncbi:lymphocyte-specific helicase-like [Macrobrachium nipponense]|uniref:lymphocyte-specific helicase-like n=1 Tax=Macrobrachium nipponense TaxID=159736 RepID=UPI0030C7ED00
MPVTTLKEDAEVVSVEDDRQSMSSGSLSPGRPATASPDHPEDAHGLSRDQTPEASEGENSNGKWETQNQVVLTSEIEAEEKKMEKESLAEEERICKELEEHREDEKELKERRYKRLMHLLNKSEFYSQFLLKQIETQDAENKKKRARQRGGRKPKEESQSEGNSSQESNGSESGRKRKASSRTSAAKRQKRDGKYNISDVIDTDAVKENAAAKDETPEDIVQAEQPRLFINGTMRPYQLDGFSWLMVLYENGVNGILGDEMGLGKTIQCIALICHLVEKGVQGPFLILGPLSTLPNWMAEFKRFAPAVPVVLYHGSEQDRIAKLKVINNKSLVEGTPHSVHPVVVTSYEVVIRDTKYLSKYMWRYLCVDEGHRLKNHKCLLAKSLNKFISSNRLLMTGTPLQNNLAELWSLLNFLMPEIFDSLDVFESWFDITDLMEDDSNERIVQQEREQQIITTLMKILSPFFLRRVKKDVNLDLPPKRELLVYTPMTSTQLSMYEATLQYDMDVFNKMMQKAMKVEPLEYDEKGRPKRKTKKGVDYAGFDSEFDSPEFEKFVKALMKEEEEKNAPKKEVQKTAVVRVKLQNRFMQMRRVVNHPYLVNYPLNKDGSYKVDEELVKTCGKLQVLDQLLEELHRRGHRVLLFSQMTMMMDILEDYLTLRPKYRYKRLDGSISLEERQIDINEFNQEKSSYFLFLISTRAGSLGINLATADTVIIYDSDWNPQCDLQAQDRCHRIGQTKPVLVLRLITASSVDERIVDRAAAKRKLEKLIIQSGKFQAGDARKRGKMLEKSIDIEELTELLKQRDHDRIHNTTTGNVFSKKEINQLLDRSDLVAAKCSSPRKGRDQLKGVFKLVEEEDNEAITSA